MTLFDYATQAMVAQQQISGPAASYSYQPLSPIWLTAGTQYVLELFPGTADGYYFGTSTQINPLLTYYEMGMLLSSIGRKNVAILKKGHVDVPSDAQGILYLGFNDHVKEVVPRLVDRLTNAGFVLDPSNITKASS